MVVLHVAPSRSEPWVLDAIRNHAPGTLQVQSIPQPALAAARVAGGGVGVILLDLSGCGNSPDLAALAVLRPYARQTPIVIAALCEDLPVEGAERVITAADAARLPALLLEAIDHGFEDSSSLPARAENCSVLAFLGVKGGVGTTTTALNIAAALARTRSVALAELRPDLGGLIGRLRAATRHGTLESLLERPAGELSARALEEVLWAPEHVPRLRILAAPAISARSAVLGADHVQKIIRLLTAKADVVVLDLAFSPRQAVRAAVSEVNQLVLVAERTPFCLAIAREISAEVFSWGVSRNAMSCLIVNRSPVGVPPPIEELESQLDTSILGVLPPDADACVKAESLRRPIITIQPEGLVAQSLDAAIRRLEARLAMGAG